MRPILALNCLLQIEQERSEEESSVGDALALAFRCARFCSASLILFASYSPAPLLMSNFPTDCSKAVSLLQFVRRWFHDAVFVLSLYAHLFFYRCLGKAVLRNCCISWISSLTF